MTPDDDRQMLLLLRAGNCDPEKAAEVTKVFLDYKRSMLGSECSSVQFHKIQIYDTRTICLSDKLPSDFKDLMEQQKKNCFALPGRDKVGL